MGDAGLDAAHLAERIRLTSGGQEEEARAAVAMVFRMRHGALQLLLVKRAVVEGDPWSGDMAFPGGKRMKGDHSIMDTVVREVQEETGIELRACRHLGSLGAVYSTVRPNLGVLPMVFLRDHDSEIRMNEELVSYQWVNLERLQKSRGRATVKGRDVPAYMIADEVVWGLTYRIIEILLKLVEKS
jgi:8-oxo-dGTP pyrophosphatase MutT (NUDIX family)